MSHPRGFAQFDGDSVLYPVYLLWSSRIDVLPSFVHIVDTPPHFAVPLTALLFGDRDLDRVVTELLAASGPVGLITVDSKACLAIGVDDGFIEVLDCLVSIKSSGTPL